MAGSPQQQLDFETPYQAHCRELRVLLARVEPAAAGVSRRRWAHVRELLMAVWSHSSKSPCRKPLIELLATSGLSKAQWYKARQTAVRLGLVRSTTAYAGERRLADTLTVDRAAIERLFGPPKSANRGEQGRTGANRGENNKDTFLTSLTLQTPPPPAATTHTAQSPHGTGAAPDWPEVEGEIFLCGVNAAAEAVRSVRGHGGSPGDVRVLIAHWRQRHAEFRFPEAVLYRRLLRWRPDQDPAALWPEDPEARAQREWRAKVQREKREYAQVQAQRRAEKARWREEAGQS